MKGKHLYMKMMIHSIVTSITWQPQVYVDYCVNQNKKTINSTNPNQNHYPDSKSYSLLQLEA